MNDVFPSQRLDCAIVGGGVAGLSAALVLGRSRKRVCVFDGGSPRNAPTPEAHNYLTQDGTPPLELLRIGREQLGTYASVQVIEGAVETISPGFVLTTREGAVYEARKVLLATGLQDELPPIDGFRERWGISVLHCPFCHGWEVRDRAFAIVGNGTSAYDLCVMAKAWSGQVTLCTDGVAEISDEQRQKLAKHGIAIREERISRVEGAGTSVERLVFAGGEELPCGAVFCRPKRLARLGLAEALGCEATDSGYIRVGDNGETTVAGVYGAGDGIEPSLQILPFAAHSGARAAIAIAKSIFEEDFA